KPWSEIDVNGLTTRRSAHPCCPSHQAPEDKPMRRPHYLLPLLCVFLTTAARGEEPPADWVDPPTGHRVLRLSRHPGPASLYFHQNGYTQKGDKLVVSTRGGLAAIDLSTIGIKPCPIEQIVEGSARAPVVGKKTRQVFYVRGGGVYATHIDTKATREIV